MIVSNSEQEEMELEFSRSIADNSASVYKVSCAIG